MRIRVDGTRWLPGVIFCTALILLQTGCVTNASSRPGFGDRAFTGISAGHVGESFLSATLSPRFWVPALGALAFGIDDADTKVSDWARDHQPIFGSGSSARSASDVFVGVIAAEALTTLVLAPSGSTDPDVEPLSGKLKGGLVELLSFGTSTTVVEGLKQTVKRTRPGSNNESSFPSGHASEAASFAVLTAKNLQAMEVSESTRKWINGGNDVLVGLTGWARVEAGKHYPSDVLAGAAIGHFLTSFVYDSLMGGNMEEVPAVDVTLEKGQPLVGVTWRF